MLGFNGGLIGKRRKQELTTPGLWLPNERAVILAGDPFRDNVSLYLRMDGPDGSTVFTDSSSQARSVSAVGSAQVSSSVFKFGSGSASIPGPGSFLSITGHSSLVFPGDFSIDLFVRPAPDSLTGFKGILEIGSFSNGIFVRSSSNTNDMAYVNGVNLGSFARFLTANTFSFIQVVRAGTAVTLAVDGVPRLFGTVSGTVNSTGAGMTVGRVAAGAPEGFTGHIDELRVTDDVARDIVNPQAAIPSY